MRRCWNLNGRQGSLPPYNANVCATSIVIISGPAGPNGGTLYYLTDGILSGDATIANLSLIPCANCPGCCTDPISPNQRFDCLNGGCIPRTTYNTPGVFANLAACQSGCAQNSNCAGECVSPAQLAALQSATNNLIARYCP